MTDIFIKSGETNNKIYVTSDSTKYFSGKAEEAAQKARNEADRAKDIVNNAQNQIISAGVQQTNLAIENIQVSAENIKNTVVDEIQLEGTTQVNLAKAEVTKATTQANNAANSATAAANSASQANTTLNSATTTINTEKTNAINAIKAQQTTSVNAVSTQQTNAIKAVQSQQVYSVNTVKSTGQSYIDKCKAWASSPNIVENGLRSAKYYAEMAQGKSDVTYETLRASRAYEDKGALLTDEQGYAEVAKYNRSSFDLSKFTVVGTPTITDDGVASGFSSSNYLKTNYILPLSTSNTWKIRCYNTISGATTSVPFEITDSSNKQLLRIQGNKASQLLVLNYLGSSTSSQQTSAISNLSLQDNLMYCFEVEFTGSAYVFKIYDTNNSLIGQTTYSSSSKIHFDGFIRIGYSVSTIINAGSNNLKQFSITVDGKEVFNGNKTGLDVIKEDNYTVVGSPVISADGVASGFSDSNFIQLPDFDTSSKFEIVGNFVATNTTTQQTLFSKSKTNLYHAIYLRFRDKKMLLGINWNGTSWGFATAGTTTIQENTRYFYKIKRDETGYKLLLSTDGINYTAEITNAYSTSPFNDATTVGLGIYFAVDPLRYGSIDLNSFKIYVDGNLVYQPCLKIPYNLSKTGSKIVPVYARDRVIDLYEQEGHAGYYTIDEENKNFTLPMGEIYGLIGQRSLKSSMVTENSRVDIYSDKTCLICGNVATAGTINLPIELANNNYFVTLSVSAKTATSFTTTATGDYILIGKVV